MNKALDYLRSKRKETDTYSIESRKSELVVLFLKVSNFDRGSKTWERNDVSIFISIQKLVIN